MQIKLAENIKAHRKQRNMTQEQLAEILGVTVGAVYKWESRASLPEIRLLIEMAALFETSVDVLLGYGWEQGSMAEAAKQIITYRDENNFEEGLPYAERALLKYPNSFEIVYQSAVIYFMSMVTYQGKSAYRAIHLFERSIALFDQNTHEDLSVIQLQNRIAGCYCYVGQMDKAIALLQKNNVDGVNTSKIGLLMSQNENRAEEALRYLSDGLYGYYARIYEICIGYANAYGTLEALDKIEDMMLWLLDVGKGLRQHETVCFMDKTDVRIYTILAEMAILRKDEAAAFAWLQKAKDSALKFDSAPEYHTYVDMKYYHGSKTTLSHDDMGETALAMIENYMTDEVVGKNLQPLWKKLCKED